MYISAVIETSIRSGLSYSVEASQIFFVLDSKMPSSKFDVSKPAGILQVKMIPTNFR